jgi:hypothetical protein
MPPGTGGAVPSQARGDEVELLARRVDQLKAGEAFVRGIVPPQGAPYIFMGRNGSGEYFARTNDGRVPAEVAVLNPDDMVGLDRQTSRG